MSADPNKVMALYLATTQMPPAVRAFFLDQSCGGDAVLRQRIEDLLLVHSQGTGEATQASEVEGPISPRTPVATDPLKTTDAAARENREGPGTRIGPYHLLQKIGEGGMGTVWMAQQTDPVERTVALKLIKPGMDSEQVIARFEAERQALALMDHPHIAKVLDAGTTANGRPYFVMELVKGVRITTFCDEKQLTPRERLELFIPVCQAIQHAHQKAIIHRDIKPSNVLVASYDGKPVVKVIDFGVAKATGVRLTKRTMFTDFGAIVGTLEYLSPEQAEFNALDIDTRSDIYSLGILLYELLTGTTPIMRSRLKEAAIDEALRLIREEDPPKPSTRLSESMDSLAAVAAKRKLEPGLLSRETRGEVDWMVMKALEKNRDLRYKSANDLALDIVRYLHDEPIEAGPPGAGYKLRKFAKRHKGSLAAAALVLLALLVGMTATALGLVYAQEQRAVAENNLERAEKAEKVALANAQQAREEAKKANDNATLALNKEAERRAVQDFFEDNVLAAARPRGQEGGLGIDATIRAAVDAAEPRIANLFKDKPLVEASIRNTLGLTYYYLGERKRATDQFDRAFKLREQILGQSHTDTLSSKANLAVVYSEKGSFDEAVKHLTQAVADSTKKSGPDDPTTLTIKNDLAVTYYKAGQMDKALPLLEAVFEKRESVLPANDPHTLMSMCLLGEAYRAAGKLEKGIELLATAVELMKEVQGPSNPDTLVAMNNLALAYQNKRNLQDAITLFKEVLELRQEHLGLTHPHTGLSMMNLGWAFADEAHATAAKPGDKRYKDGIELLESARKLLQEAVGPHDADTLRCMNNLAVAYYWVGRRDEALQLFVETTEKRLLHLRPNHRDTLASLNTLGHAYLGFNRLQDAEKRFRAAADGAKQEFGLDNGITQGYLVDFAKCCEAMGKPEKAESARRELAKFWRDAGPDAQLVAAQKLAELGHNLLRQRKYEAADTELRTCLAIRKLKQPEDWTTFNAQLLLGTALLGQQKYPDAEKELVGGYEGIKKREQLIPPDSRPQLLETLQRIVQLYEETGQKEKADEWRKKSKDSTPAVSRSS